MKLRVRGDSIRLRLTRSEVDALARDGRVEERVRFGGGVSLAYAVESADVAAMEARYEGDRITVRFPRAEVVAWAAGDAVGMRAERSVEGSEVLRVAVEKDFACLSVREGEDDRDAFAHPGAACEAPVTLGRRSPERR